MHLSYLPMSHFFERYWIWSMIYFGGSIVVATDGVNNFAEDLRIVKPTFLVSIPKVLFLYYLIAYKVFTKIYQNIKNEIEN